MYNHILYTQIGFKSSYVYPGQIQTLKIRVAIIQRTLDRLLWVSATCARNAQELAKYEHLSNC